MATNKLNYPVIVVVAFNRIHSIKRVLTSISVAKYPKQNITIIISIDRAANNQEVVQFAENFKWLHGDKKVVYQEQNLGLRKHILKCMNYAVTYGSMLLLEDDLLVSPNFYNYTTAALNFSIDKNEIAGVSLYNHQFNVHTAKNFLALDDGYDNWYFQFASSWGQAWSKTHVLQFLEWYNKNPKIENNSTVPAYVRSWSDKSWLKFFIAFVIEKNRFFIYPQISLTTNFGDKGTHMATQTTCFQVPLAIGNKTVFNFSNLTDSKSVYDGYFENLKLSTTPEKAYKDITFDLYGYKTEVETRYLLSSKKYNYRILKNYGKNLRPLDANIIYDIEGYDFHLYDRSIDELNKFKTNELKEIMYQVKYLNLTNLFVLLRSFLFAKMRNAIIKLKLIKQ
jgi:hypothetical protein